MKLIVLIIVLASAENQNLELDRAFVPAFMYKWLKSKGVLPVWYSNDKLDETSRNYMGFLFVWRKS